jgi:hypothetical protein
MLEFAVFECRRNKWVQTAGSGWSFSDDFYEHPLAPAAVELTLKDLFPGTEVKPASGHGYHHLAAHDLALQVGVGVVLAEVVPDRCSSMHFHSSPRSICQVDSFISNHSNLL